MATFASVTIHTVSPVGSTGVSQAAQGSDGRIWCYAPQSPSTADFVAVAPGGAVTSYSGTYEGIAAGVVSIGVNLWFQTFSSTKIVKVTTAGVSTVYSATYAERCCVGPDGRVWGVVANNTFVSAINISGASPVTASYNVNGGIPNDTGGGVCTDGTYIWVPMLLSSTGAPYVARVTTAGVVTIIALAAGGTVPAGCCLGSDGRVWITAIAAPFGAWALDPSTSVSTWYPMPLGTGTAGQLAATLGPDGNVYAPDRAVIGGSGVVWQITTAGVWTAYTGVGVTALTSVALTDSSGGMWFSFSATGGLGAALLQCILPATPTSQIVMVV